MWVLGLEDYWVHSAYCNAHAKVIYEPVVA
jgi:hypothetical protein